MSRRRGDRSNSECASVVRPKQVAQIDLLTSVERSEARWAIPSADWLMTAVVAGALSFSKYNAAVFHDFAKEAGG
jgi:hypothetical protein